MSGAISAATESGGYHVSKQVQVSNKGVDISKDFTGTVTFDTKRGTAVTISLSVSAQTSLEKGTATPNPSDAGEASDVFTASHSGTLELQTTVDRPNGDDRTSTLTDSWANSTTLSDEASS